MYRFTTFREAEEALDAFVPSRLNRHAYTTEFIQRFLEYVDNPQDKPRAIHIAGTSGKTSTAYYAASLLKAAGRRVGMLTSPHTSSLNERVQINLEPLPEKAFCEELATFMDILEESGMTLSHAEILYAFGYWEFARQRVEYIVIEVGMGGLLDATNVISREDKVCIITDIGLDHTNVLGGTIQEIAQHKAGIIHLHNTVFCYDQDPAAVQEIRAASKQQKADLHVIHPSDHVKNISHLPLFQRRNFSLAYQAVSFELQHREDTALTSTEIEQASRIRIPARMEVLEIGDKRVIIDGAHNPQKLKALVASMKEAFPNEKIAALIALTSGRGRNLQDELIELRDLNAHIIATSLPDNVHSHTASDIAAGCTVLGFLTCEAIPDPGQAYQALLRRPEPVVLITGSLYLVQHLQKHVASAPVD